MTTTKQTPGMDFYFGASGINSKLKNVILERGHQTKHRRRLRPLERDV